MEKNPLSYGVKRAVNKTSCTQDEKSEADDQMLRLVRRLGELIGKILADCTSVKSAKCEGLTGSGSCGMHPRSHPIYRPAAPGMNRDHDQSRRTGANYGRQTPAGSRLPAGYFQLSKNFRAVHLRDVT